jgi:hypothetical protein
MSNLTKQISTKGDQMLQFTFTPIHTVNGLIFLVSVIDIKQQVHTVTLRNRENSWRIVHSHVLPSWIAAVEGELSTTIEQYLSTKDSTGEV